ncbi:MAG: TlpA disulfide reductase family protein [Bacteroidales bacterium]|nr:TlpA disulfide reductase family protein [Bacteroidales bacterium]
MNKKITRSLLALLLIVAISPAAITAQQKTIVVSGSVQFDVPGAKMQIFTGSGPDKRVLAEFDIDENRRFRQEIKVDQPGVLSFDCKKTELLNFWAEDESVELNYRGADTAKVKSTSFTAIKGGPKNDLMNLINHNIFLNRQMSNSTSAVLKGIVYTSPAERDKATRAISDLNTQDLKERMVYLSELFPETTSIVAVLNYFNYQRDRDIIDKISAKIYAIYPNYPPLDKFYKTKEEAAERTRKMAIGATAPEFAFPTPDGKLLGPKDYRGKTLIIDFWASWCGPCIAEIPHLKKLYENYKDKGLEILSVSIDKDGKEWLKAVETIQMPWKQILSPNAGAELMGLYQFNMIPFIILIDKEGKIVNKHLRGEALETAVKALIGLSK